MKPKAMWPKVPIDAEDAVQLKEDLERMGLGHLLTVPWGFQDPMILGEMIGEQERPEEYRKSMRSSPELWTPELISRVYKLSNEGAPLATQKETSGEAGLTKDLDLTKAKVKDGFTTADILRPRLRRVFEFLIPILNADHPDRFFKGLAVTIGLSFRNRRNTNWAVIFHDTIQKGVLGNNRGSYSSSFCYHIYHYAGLLMEDELEKYEAKKAEWEFGAHEEEEVSELVTRPKKKEPVPPAKKRPVVPEKKKPPPPSSSDEPEKEEEEVREVARVPPQKKKIPITSTKKLGEMIGDRQPRVRPSAATATERVTADSGARQDTAGRETAGRPGTGGETGVGPD